MRKTRKVAFLALLLFTVVAPILLYTDTAPSSLSSSSLSSKRSSEIRKLNVLPQESSNTLKEPVGLVYSASINSSNSLLPPAKSSTQELPLQEKVTSTEHITRVLSTTDEEIQSLMKNPIKQVVTTTTTTINDQLSMGTDTIDSSLSHHTSHNSLANVGTITNKQSADGNSRRENVEKAIDGRVRHLKDQLIRARVYLSLGATRNNPHFIKELRLRIKEVQRALGDASKDSELPKNAYDKLKAMEQTLGKGKQIQDDCTGVVKKLRAILHSTEEQLRVHKKQTMFLTQLAAKTLPKGLHCLPLRLATEYFSLNSSQQQFPNEERLEDPKLYHYALFSDNILAAAAVVNSTISNAQVQEKNVFHIVTDKLNYASMRMWFLANPPGRAAVQVQNIEELTWLNSSYSPVLKQLGTPSMIDYYFKAHRGANTDSSNLKFRNPKYLSILNHLRFYLPEIFPKLSKLVFLDDDIIVQKDLSGLWSIDLKGKVNGAVETCREGFHRYDRYLNFSNPLIANNFDPRACGWAYGMNVFDLDQWKKLNITQIYHSWQKLNSERELWKLGTLPPGLITFWKQTFAIDGHWHVLGLGYNPSINHRDIERAAVIHYNGNMKPWLEIGIPKYKGYWTRYVDYEQLYLRECNINP